MLDITKIKLHEIRTTIALPVLRPEQMGTVNTSSAKHRYYNPMSLLIQKRFQNLLRIEQEEFYDPEISNRVARDIRLIERHTKFSLSGISGHFDNYLLNSFKFTIKYKTSDNSYSFIFDEDADMLLSENGRYQRKKCLEFISSKSCGSDYAWFIAMSLMALQSRLQILEHRFRICVRNKLELPYGIKNYEDYIEKVNSMYEETADSIASWDYNFCHLPFSIEGSPHVVTKFSVLNARLFDKDGEFQDMRITSDGIAWYLYDGLDETFISKH